MTGVQPSDSLSSAPNIGNPQIVTIVRNNTVPVVQSEEIYGTTLEAVRQRSCTYIQ